MVRDHRELRRWVTPVPKQHTISSSISPAICHPIFEFFVSSNRNSKKILQCHIMVCKNSIKSISRERKIRRVPFGICRDMVSFWTWSPHTRPVFRVCSKKSSPIHWIRCSPSPRIIDTASPCVRSWKIARAPN